jgi:universal stress protein A
MLPPRTLLAGIDFSEGARAALDFAARLATHCRARLHVLHAHDPAIAGGPNPLRPAVGAEAADELRAFGASVPSLRPDSWVPHIVIGSAPDVICHIADRERADVIVLGAHGLEGAGRPFIGSTAEAVLRCGDVSVLIVPAGWKPPRPRSADLTGIGPVVVGVELSEPALGAAAAAARLAAALGATLELVHVVPRTAAAPRWRARADDVAAQQVVAARRDLGAPLEGLGQGATPPLTVVVGSIPEALARAGAPASGRDPLLVLGRRARATGGHAPAATANRVLAMTRGPVLVHLPDPEE